MRPGNRLANLVNVPRLITLDPRNIDKQKGLIPVVEGVRRIALGEIGFTGSDDRAIYPTCRLPVPLELDQQLRQPGKVIIEQWP